MIGQFEKKAKFALPVSLLWLYSCSTVFLLLYMTYNSLRTKSDLLSNTFGKPKSLSIENYIKVFTEDRFYVFFKNSLIILIASLLLVILCSSMVAYGIGRYTFRLNRAMRIYFLIGLMFPAQLGVLPIFILMKNLHLLDSLTSVILILASHISMPVLLLTVFFEKMPAEIYESALIEGASEWKIFYRIMFPLASPVIFSVCIILSVQIWNQFFIPLIFLQSEENKTLPLMIMKYTGNLILSIDKALVSSVVATIPILLVFVKFANKILEGVTSGAVKG